MNATKRLFRIQYVSDIHLEFYDKLAFPLIVKPVARYLALAGDIGHPSSDLFRSFLDYTSRNWDHIFYVAGNHEYYTKKPAKHWAKSTPTPMFETHEAIKSVVSTYSNIHYLHHDAPSVYLRDENVAVVGSTLWTHISEDAKADVSRTVNDYNCIPMADGTTIRRLTPDDVNMLHGKEKAMMEAHIDYWGSQKAQVVALTHHMPSYSFISPRFVDNPYNCAFASHCEQLMKPHVRAWIYGHTHNAATAIVKNTVCVVNARGYPHESVPGFRNDAWYEFPVKESTDAIEDTDLVAAAAGIRPPCIDENIEFV